MQLFVLLLALVVVLSAGAEKSANIRKRGGGAATVESIKRVLVFRTVGGLSNVMYGFAIALEVARKQHRDLFIDATHHPLFEGLFLHQFFNFRDLEEKYKLRITENYKDISHDLVWHANYYNESSPTRESVAVDIPMDILGSATNYHLSHVFEKGGNKVCLNKSQQAKSVWQFVETMTCVKLKFAINTRKHPNVANEYQDIRIAVSPPPSDDDGQDVVVFATGKYESLFNAVKSKNTPTSKYQPCGFKVKPHVAKHCRDKDNKVGHRSEDAGDARIKAESNNSANSTVGGFVHVTTGFHLQKLQGHYIGVHFRNTDIQTDVHDTVIRIVQLLERKKQKTGVVIYLASDDDQAFQLIAGAFMSKHPFYSGTIVQYTHIPSGVSTVIHDETSRKSTHKLGLHHLNNNKTEVTLNMMVDMYYLVHAGGGYLGSAGSGMSGWIQHMRNDKGRCSIFNK